MSSWNIAHLEGLALLIGFGSFQHLLKNKDIMIHVDNAELVACLVNKWAQNTMMMAFVYELCMLSIKFKSRFYVEWISTTDNWIADFLSRDKITKLMIRMESEGIFMNVQPSTITIPALHY